MHHFSGAPMSNTERAGVDIQVALARFATDVDPQPNRAPAPQQQQQMPLASPPLPLRTQIKRKARPVARAIYQLLKPALRPLAFRLRAYFAEPVLAELRRQQEESHRATVQQIETSMRQLLAAHTMQTLQEIQAARESLRRRVAVLGDFAEQLGRIEQYGYAAARRVAVPCGPDELLVRTVLGYVLCPASDQALLMSLMEAGELEPGTRILIQRVLAAGETFVDVGANIGMHTLAAGFTLQGQGRIVAFEPFPQTCRLLRKTIWMNGFSGITETHQAAASNQAGSQALFLGATSGHHSLYRLASADLAEQAPVEVPLVRIDDVLRDNPKVDLMKIDVEGAELDVIEGAAQTISANPDIGLIVEFGLSHLGRSKRSTQDWLDAFRRFGLEFGVIDDNTGALVEWSAQQLETRPSVNLFFARPGSRAWNRAWGVA